MIKFFSHILAVFEPSRVLAQVKVPQEVPIITSGDPNQTFIWGRLFPGLVQILLLIAIIISFVFLLLGGISWITSGGNKDAIEGAKKRLTYAILGLVLVLLSFFIIFTLGDIFGVNFR